jgi:hypothetical protein
LVEATDRLRDPLSGDDGQDGRRHEQVLSLGKRGTGQPLTGVLRGRISRHRPGTADAGRCDTDCLVKAFTM